MSRQANEMSTRQRSAPWFEDMFGVAEPAEYTSAQALFSVENDGTDDAVLVSRANGARFHLGRFETPSLAELDDTLHAVTNCVSGDQQGLVFENILDDVRSLHVQPECSGAVFQVASQFNALEMASPDLRPDDGVTRYAHDMTQGPACALSCPAATVYRNYLVHGRGQGGGAQQINTLSDVATLLDNDAHAYWTLRNGYALPSTRSSLQHLYERLTAAEPAAAELAVRIASALRVGVHTSTQVGGDAAHRVAQVFCSALPVAYSKTPAHVWAPFARAVLAGAMQATLACAATLAHQRNKRQDVYLTCLGGGVFGNPPEWIADAIAGALSKYRAHPLNVRLVHFYRGTIAPEYAALQCAFEQRNR